MKSRIARFAGIVAGATLALGAFAPAASALTVADIQMLQAAGIINSTQAAALMAQTTGSASASVSFTRDLTIGSTGSDVTALQNWLISQGYSIPAGATGYFGSQTKTAVARWQAAAGISPAAGYFGPISRSHIGMVGGSTGGTTTGGTVTTGGTTGGSTGTITTPGVEGTLTVTAGPISNTVMYVGQTKVPVMTIRAQATRSDIDVQRVTVDLGSSTSIYNKIFSTLYLVDNATGAVLASTPLNSSTVLQNGNSYMTTISGFHFVVPANTYKDLSLRADVYSSIDSAYLTGGASAVTDTFTIPVNGVRGIDGAGVDQFGPSTAISQTVTVNRSLVDAAQANVSLAPSTPLTSQVPVTDTTNGQYLQLPVMAFNVYAQNDTLHLHQVTVNFAGSSTNGTATATAAYLYNGSTQIASASINSTTGVAVFSNIVNGTAGASIPAGTTQTFTVKADVTGVTSGTLTVTATLDTTGSDTLIYKSDDSTATLTGSAVGNTQTVLGKGPAFTLLSKSITKGATSIQNNQSTSTLSATFNIQVQAIGADVLVGDQASSNPMVVFGVYKGGTLTALNVASTSSMQVPSAGVTYDSGKHTLTIPQNATVQLPVTFLFEGRTVNGGLASTDNYAVGVESLHWVASGTAGSATFTSGQTAWRTDTQPLP
jgi:peptidoglycan hydrolase-like protein with peptidoglycan-binding domain